MQANDAVALMDVFHDALVERLVASGRARTRAEAIEAINSKPLEFLAEFQKALNTIAAGMQKAESTVH